MIIDINSLDESTKTEMLELAVDSVENYDGRFTYNKKHYKARKLADKSIEIEESISNSQKLNSEKTDMSKEFPAKYKMNNWGLGLKQEFRLKIQTAKESNDENDKIFTIDGMRVHVKNNDDGTFNILIRDLSPRNTGSLDL